MDEARGVWGAAPGALLVTSRSMLVEQVERLAGAAGVRLQVAPDVAAAGTGWREARAVLLGDDAAAQGVPLRRPGVLLVAPAASGLDDAPLWRAAVTAGASGVAVLPDQAPAVAAALASAAEGPGVRGRLLGVVGGCGGAGASVLAASTATLAAARRPLLVDADPRGGGLDLLLGAADEAGLRWPDLLDARPPLRAAALRDGLPRSPAGVPVLAWAPGSPGSPGSDGVPAGPAGAVPAAAVEAVVGAAARSSELVVLDLPRDPGPATAPLLWQLDLLVVVVPAQLRAVAAAQALLPEVLGRAGDVRLVVAVRPGAPLHPDDVADALALPLVGRLDHDREVRSALARGEPLPRPAGALARCARAVLEALDDTGDHDGPTGTVGPVPAGRAAAAPRGRRRRG